METRSRQLIIDTLQPTMQKVHTQKEEIVSMGRTIHVLQLQVKDLEYTVFKKN